MARELMPCGTNAAYARHKRRGEPIDDTCEAAHRAYNARWMQEARTQYPMGTCAACERRRPIQRRRWCESCVTRWQDAGRPDTGPPPLDPEAVRVARAQGAVQARAVRDLNEALRRGGWEWATERRRANA